MSLADDLFGTVVDIAGAAWDAQVSATITRPHTLTTGGRTAALEVATVAALGAASVTLRAVRAEPSTVVPLAGGAPAGIVLTIGATAHAVTAAAQASANVITLTISPALVAGLAVAAPVALAGAATFNLGTCLRQGVSSRLPPDLAARTSFELLVPAGANAPKDGDLITAGGTTGTVVGVDVAGGGWAVQVGPG